MERIIGNFLKSISLFVPTLFCLYATNLYALNMFRFVMLYKIAPADRLMGIRYGVISILTGGLSYFIFLAFWWGLLNLVWKNHPKWISPKSWSNISINGLIATGCLYIGFFCEPSLWIYANVFMSSTSEYSNYIIETTFPKLLVTWLFAVNAAYFIKDSLEQSDQYPTSTNYPLRQSSSKPQRQANRDQFRQLERQQISELLEREKELLSLIRDRKTCERLLRSLRRQYPNETSLWIVEKAISDIERDRRA